MKRTCLLVVVLLTTAGLSRVAAQDQQTGTARAPGTAGVLLTQCEALLGTVAGVVPPADEIPSTMAEASQHGFFALF